MTTPNPFPDIPPARLGHWSKQVHTPGLNGHACDLPPVPAGLETHSRWRCGVCATTWELMSLPPARLGMTTPDPGAWSDRQPAADRYGPDKARWCAWGWRNARRLRRANAVLDDRQP